MDELPPLPWRIDPPEETPGVYWILDADGKALFCIASEDSELAVRVVAAATATADPAVLALAEHLAAMDPLQRGAAMDQIKHAIGDWG